MPTVLITAPGVSGPDDPRLQPLRDAGWRIKTHRWPGKRPGDEELIELVQGNDAVIASSAERYTRSAQRRKLSSDAVVFLKRPEAKDGT